LKPSEVFIPTVDVKKATNTVPEVLADEVHNQDNSNDDIMEVHESPVISSCIVVVEDGRDAPAPTC
jgi:hypothetical protein